MGKILGIIICTSLLLTSLALTVVPAMAADGPSIRFLGANYLSGKGLVLYFDVPSDLDPGQVENSVVVDGVSYSLTCHFNARGLLVCIAPVKKSGIGHSADVSFGGMTFNLTIPEVSVPRITPGVTMCAGYSVGSYVYDVFDYDSDLVWHSIGTHTQDCPAAVGDAIPFFSPDWGDTELHYYSLDGSDNCAPDLGDGYYFEFCW